MIIRNLEDELAFWRDQLAHAERDLDAIIAQKKPADAGRHTQMVHAVRQIIGRIQVMALNQV